MILSVIVPVYNVETFLSACVGSILPSLGSEAELILVDDGSSDHSGALCDRYAESSEFIRVIHQPNRGVSAARNAGIDAARGDYLMFVDADDFLEPEALPRICDVLASDPDLLLLRAWYHFPDGTMEEIFGSYRAIRFEGKSGVQVFAALCTRYQTGFWSPGCSVSRRTLVNESGIRFPEGIRMMEDFVWAVHLFSTMRSVTFLDEPLYHYRQARSGSAMTEVCLQAELDCFAVCRSMADTLGARDMSDSDRRDILDKIGHLAASHAQQIPRLSAREDRETALSALRELRGLIRASRNPRARGFSLLWSFFGLRTAVRILDVRRRLLR